MAQGLRRITFPHVAHHVILHAHYMYVASIPLRRRTGTMSKPPQCLQRGTLARPSSLEHKEKVNKRYLRIPKYVYCCNRFIHMYMHSVSYPK